MQIPLGLIENYVCFPLYRLTYKNVSTVKLNDMICNVCFSIILASKYIFYIKSIILILIKTHPSSHKSGSVKRKYRIILSGLKQMLITLKRLSTVYFTIGVNIYAFCKFYCCIVVLKVCRSNCLSRLNIDRGSNSQPQAKCLRLYTLRWLRPAPIPQVSQYKRS